MLRTAVLAVHVAAGSAGLLVGPAAMAAAMGNDRRARSATAYLAAVTVLTITAAGLVAFDRAGLWPFLLLAAATEAAAVGARRTRRLGWHVRLVCGSYVSLVTALLVVSWGSLLAWVLPTAIGTILVELAAHRAARATAPTGSPPPARTPSRSPTP